MYDSQEHDHWTIIYSIERPPEGSKLPAAASVGEWPCMWRVTRVLRARWCAHGGRLRVVAMVHYTQSQKKVSAVEKFPLRLLHVSNDFDLRFMDEGTPCCGARCSEVGTDVCPCAFSSPRVRQNMVECRTRSPPSRMTSSTSKRASLRKASSGI